MIDFSHETEPRLNRLEKRINTCRACNLALTRTNALPGAGNVRARLMIIAQAPGDQEDRKKRHFIGPSGRILDELLSTARMSRKEFFLTNLLKCRLPGFFRTAVLERPQKGLPPAPPGSFALHSLFPTTG